MATVTISLPDPMKEWVEAEVGNGQYSGVSDYIRDLIRRDQNARARQEALVQALVEGEESGEPREWRRDDLLAEARRRARLKRAG